MDLELLGVVTKILEMSEVEVELLKGVVERGSREDLSYLIFLLGDALAVLDAAHKLHGISRHVTPSGIRAASRSGMRSARPRRRPLIASRDGRRTGNG
jgi:hypothetical protein